MKFRFVVRVFMVMRTMLARVFMVMYLASRSMRMFMKMFVQVLVSMAVGMLMAVRLAVMRMFVGVRMDVIMRMQMLVFVFSFHAIPPNALGCQGPS